MHLYEKRPGFPLKGLAISVAAFLCVVILFSLLLGRIGQSATREQEALLEKAILNAAVTGYAINGVYPASLDEIQDDYGIIVDKDRFIVHYDVFASNLMPQVSVIFKGEGAT